MRAGGSGMSCGRGPSVASERQGSMPGYVDRPVNEGGCCPAQRGARCREQYRGGGSPRPRGRGGRRDAASRPALARRRGLRLMSRAAAADKRRVILDAAVKVFARQGFHACRVSDIAEEAGVAYGLVYHYFSSKDEVLDTLFLERWDVLLDTIREVDAGDAPAREKLRAIAGFIVESYRHDPDLMKVIIVEVTRAANSFGRTHLGKIREAYQLIADVVARAQATGEFRDDITPQFAALAFYGAVEQVLTGWIFGVVPEEFDQARAFVVQTVCEGLDRRT